MSQKYFRGFQTSTCAGLETTKTLFVRDAVAKACFCDSPDYNYEIPKEPLMGRVEDDGQGQPVIIVIQDRESGACAAKDCTTGRAR